MFRVPSLADVRRRVRTCYPFFACYCIFIGLILLLPYPRVNRNFYYLFLLAPVLLALNRDDWRKLAGSWVLRIALVYAAALAGTLIWNPPNEPARILTSIRHIAICLTFVGLTAWLMARDQRHQDQFIRWFGWIALFGAAVALWMFYSAHPITERFVAGYWSNPNTAGAIFGLAVVAIASVATSDWIVARLRWIDLIPALVLFACVVLTGSRTALAAVVASLLACFIIVRLWKPLAWSLAGGGVLFVVALVFNWADLARWTARLGGGARLEAWSHFWDLARERLWTGYGIENEFAYRHQLGKAFSGETLDNPHNMLLSSVFYGGLPAGAAYLALAAAMVAWGVVVLRRTGVLAPLALAFYAIVHGVFEAVLPVHQADWQWVYFWLPIAIVAAAELRLNQTATAATGAAPTSRQPLLP